MWLIPPTWRVMLIKFRVEWGHWSSHEHEIHAVRPCLRAS